MHLFILESIKNRVLKPALRLGSQGKPASMDCTARCFPPLASGLAVLHPLFYALQNQLSLPSQPPVFPGLAIGSLFVKASEMC